MAFARHAKHWLVPHRRNNHRPYLLRRRGLAAVAGLIIAVQGLAFVTAPAAVKVARAQGSVLAYASGSITPAQLLALTNQQRAASGLPALRMDSRLNASAQAKAQNMFAENYWAHVSPSGIQPWFWFTQAGYGYNYAGENLAKDFDTSAGTMEGWMNSPGHRANLLNPNYLDVGFAVVNGTITGGQTTLVVAHYGQAKPGSAPVVAAAKPVVAATPRPLIKAPAVAADTMRATTSVPASTPVPLLVTTPIPSTITTPVPKPLPAPLPVPVSKIESAPAPQAYSLFQPLALTRTMAWPSLVTLALLLLVLGVYVFTHMTVWRKGLKRWESHHYRYVAAAQIGGLAVIMFVIVASSFGRVG